MAQQLKQKTEAHDKEIMEVNYVAIATVVKDTVKKSKIKASKQKKTIVEKENLPISGYLAHRQAKIRRNEAHMNSLGLGSSSSRLRITLPRKLIAPKMKSPKRKTPISSTTTTKKVLQKGRGNPSLKSKQNNINDQDSKTESEVSCTHTHKEFVTGYKAEDDKRYWKDDAELFGITCMGCKKEIVHKEKKDCIVPCFAKPIHICIGRHSFNCYHCFCDDCYQKRNIIGVTQHRRSRRKIN